MLRKTAIELTKVRTLNKRTCTKAVEAMHENFTPRLTWIEKCFIVAKIHDYKIQHSRVPWSVEKTSEYIQLTYHHTLELLRLFDGLTMYPNLNLIKNSKTAAGILRSEFPRGTLDAYIIENKLDIEKGYTGVE